MNIFYRPIKNTKTSGMFVNQTPCPAQKHVPGVLGRLREGGLLEHRDSRLKTV